MAAVDKREFLLRVLVLSLIYGIAFFSRLFSVLRYESVIHEVSRFTFVFFKFN